MPQKIWQMILAGLFIATGINGFVVPAHLISGGIWGVSLLVNYLWGFNLAIVFIGLNLPIYFFAIKYDLSYFFKGMIGTFISAIFIKLLAPLTFLFHFSLLPSAIIGGLLIGIGVGMMLRVHASPGGVDLLALLLSKKTSINPGFLLLGIDAAIIVSGVVALRDGRLLYSLLIISIVGIIAAFLTGIKSIEVF